MGTERLKLKFKLNHKRSQEITELCSKISLLLVFSHHLPFEAVPEKDEELSADAGQYWLTTDKDDIWSTTVSDWITDKNTSNINHHSMQSQGRQGREEGRYLIFIFGTLLPNDGLFYLLYHKVLFINFFLINPWNDLCFMYTILHSSVYNIIPPKTLYTYLYCVYNRLFGLFPTTKQYKQNAD